FFPMISIDQDVFDEISSLRNQFQIELSDFRAMTNIDAEILLKLFDLSIHPYSEIGGKAQWDLFSILNYCPFSYEILVDHIVNLFDTHADVEHD
ncbi:unnamed protein product, partial [Adineta ricciae]